MDSKLHLFIGCLNREAPYFQGARGRGIAIFSFDEETLEAFPLGEADDIDNPTFLSVDSARRLIYANSEVFGWREGTVSAYRFDEAEKRLIYINKQAALGSITAHNCISQDGRFLLVANYAMGDGGPDRAVAVYRIEPDGALSPAVHSVRHSGSGPNSDRQERSHAHCIVQSADGSHILVSDLGLDQVISYRLGQDGSLNLAGSFALPPGAGPRHLAPHPNGRLVFATNELDSTVASLRWQEGGMLELCDLQPAVPDEARAGNHCADIHVSPDGRFVYASNRGDDSLAVFSADPDSGRLALVQHFPSGGRTPRNFALTPSGRHVLVANQNSDSVTVLARAAETGRLSDTGRSIAVGSPVCVRVARFAATSETASTSPGFASALRR